MRGLLVFASAIACASMACGSPPPGAPAAAGPATITLRLTGPTAGAIVAYQDGEGPWRPLDAVAEQPLEVASERYGVLVGCVEEELTPARVVSRSVRVAHRAVAEGREVEAHGCTDPDRPQVLIRGRLLGLGLRQGRVSAGYPFAANASAQGDYTLRLPGDMDRVDLVALVGEGDGERRWRSDALAIVRDVSLGGGDAAVDVDLAAASPTQTRSVAVQGADPDEGLQVRATWHLAGGAVFEIGVSDEPSLTYQVPPEALLSPGDAIEVHVSGESASGSRSVSVRDPAPGHTFVLPAAGPPVEARWAGDGVSVHGRWDAGAAVDLAIWQHRMRRRDVVFTSWRVELSRGWTAGGERPWTTPDLSHVPRGDQLALLGDEYVAWYASQGDREAGWRVTRQGRLWPSPRDTR